MKAQVRWVRSPERPPALEQRLEEARVLALCAMAVAKIDRDPALLEVVHRNFGRWTVRGCGPTGAVIRAWRKLLKQPWPEVSARLTEQSEQGVRLRSITPLFGILTARERRRIAGAFRLPRVEAPRGVVGAPQVFSA